jgi:TRAP transporter TAXI family solute receptor
MDPAHSNAFAARLRRFRSIAVACAMAASLVGHPTAQARAVPRPAPPAPAVTDVTVSAGKKDMPSHVMARQFATALFEASNGTLDPHVVETPGSVQNIIGAVHAHPNYVFTATPSLIHQAQKGEKPFPHSPRYQEIRALFPLPYTTVHWVVRQDSGIKSFADLPGHAFVAGSKGTYSEWITEAVLQSLGLAQRAQLIDIEPDAAQGALVDNKVSGMALAGSYPMPRLVEIAKAAPLRLLGLSTDEAKKVLSTEDDLVTQTIPKDTYPGVDTDTTTLAVPAGVYTTEAMSDATAYAITKIFWAQHFVLAKRNPVWTAINAGDVAAMGVKLHKGALRYYEEAGVAVPQSLK